MSAARRRTGKTRGRGIIAGLFSGRVLLVVAALAVMAGVVTGVYHLWMRMGDRILASDRYFLDPHDIECTQPPPWVRSDIKQDVIDNGTLDRRLWMFDEDLTKQVADEFMLHPWVADVVRVQKHFPAGITVELVYRTPIAVVAVDGESTLRPIDPTGVELPPSDFTQSEIARLPRIASIESAPPGPVGTVWRNPRVQDAARIAEVLSGKWRRLRLQEIVPATNTKGGGDPDGWIYVLVTQQGRRITWGHAPGRETLGELTGEEKLQRLIEYALTYRSLDDVGHGGGLLLYQSPTPRTADSSANAPQGRQN